MGCRLENAGAGGADGNDLFGFGDPFGEAGWNFISFRMHGVIAEVRGFDGAKCSQADVESEKGVV